ncbi:MAG: hypothetical protein HKN51_11395 [Saprospiraceae bacterium]|nr:hypothetical protein [Saprospiraceae bacterium]
MPIAKSSSLVNLINALSKSEKRHFKIYANRFNSNKDGFFLKLFDTLESKTGLSDEAIIDRLHLKNKTQFANVKRHLFEQILISLRLQHSTKNEVLSFNQALDFSHILDSKNLKTESLELLYRYKTNESILNQEDHLILLKTINTLTKETDYNIANELFSLKQNLKIEWELERFLSTLITDFNDLGFTRNDREYQLRKKFFSTSLIDLSRKSNNQTHRLTLFKARIVYYKCNHQYLNIYKESYKQLISILNSNSSDDDLKKTQLFALEYLLYASFNLNNKIKFNKYYKLFLKLSDNDKLQSISNSKSIILMLDHLTINQKFRNLYHVSESLINQCASMQLTANEQALIHYKLALLFAYKGDYDQAINLFIKILEFDKIDISISLYSKLIMVLCHYRLNHFEFVDNQIPNIRTAFRNNQMMTKTIDASLIQLKRGVKALNFGLKDDIDNLLEKLNIYNQSPYEKTSFLYFDFYFWFVSIMLDITVDKAKNSL